MTDQQVSLKELPEVDVNSLDLTTIEVGPKIGEGQFAKVYIGRFGGDHVAVKKQILEHDEDSGEPMLQQYQKLELKVLQFCEHKHILRYVGCYVDQGSTWIVTEYVACGDLLRLLEDQDQETLEWYLRLRIARELAEAVAYMHGRNLMHRDIKSSNVLLDATWHVKLGDFGLATEVHNGRAATLCGTNEYMAPELHMGESETYGLAADVYSIGMVFLEISLRQKASVCAPRSPRDHFKLDDAVLREKMDAAEAPSSFIELAMQCLAYEDYDRLESEDVRGWLEELVLEVDPQNKGESFEPTLAGGPRPSGESSSDSGSVASTFMPAPLAVPAFSGGDNNETDELPARTEQPLSSVSDTTARETDTEGSQLMQKPVHHVEVTLRRFSDAGDPPAHSPPPPPPPQTAGASPSDDEVSSSPPKVPRPVSKEKTTTTTRPPSGAGRGLALMAQRRIHSLREVGIDTTRMVGFLNKKTRTSFAARYQRRWFVLKNGTLLWFSQPGNANALGRLALSSMHDIVATGKTKFAIYAKAGAASPKSPKGGRFLRPTSPRSNSSSKDIGARRASGVLSSGDEGTKKMRSTKPLLELAAPDETNKDMWLQALQTEIDLRITAEANMAKEKVLEDDDDDEHDDYLPLSRPTSGNSGYLTPVPSSPAARSEARSSRDSFDRQQQQQQPRGGEPTSVSSNTDVDDGLPKTQDVVGGPSSRMRGSLPLPPPKSEHRRLDVATWIDMLRLPPDIAELFTNAGYTNLAMIFEMGLTDEDFGYIGVQVPLHRRLLKAAAHEGTFSPSLRSQVVDYRNSGQVAFYVINSRYKFRRSTLHLRYANFVTLYAKLRSIERERAQTASPFAEHGEPLPKLPGSRVFIDAKGPLFLEQRRKELDEYLQKTIIVSGNDPKLHGALLKFLEVGDVDAKTIAHRSTTAAITASTRGSSSSGGGQGSPGCALPVD